MKKITRPTRWTAFMDQELRTLWPMHSAEAIAAIMNLTHHRISGRAKKLGLEPHSHYRKVDPKVWIAAAKAQSIIAQVPVGEILSGRKFQKVAVARWRAFQSVLDHYPNASIASLARVSGFDHTSIMHGLSRLRGNGPEGARSSQRATGRRPANYSNTPIILEAAE